MTPIPLGDGDARELFTHALLWGAAAIAGDAGITGVRLTWTRGLAPRPLLEAAGLDAAGLAAVVKEHARVHDDPGGWIQQPLPSEPKRGLFSPRISRLPRVSEIWQGLHEARRSALDREAATLDLRLIAALGEPCWWRIRQDQTFDQDRAASRLEMQPRNQGSEFVGSRLRPLTAIVAARAPQEISDGLTGSAVRDEMGKGKPDSRTAANLRPLRPTDDAAAYVALWGLSCVPLVHLVHGPSRTAGDVSRTSAPGSTESFVVPVWEGPWTPARLRTVMASGALARIAAHHDDGRNEGVGERDGDAGAWLLERGVRGYYRVPFTVSGSTSAPERRAVLGQPVPLGVA